MSVVKRHRVGLSRMERLAAVAEADQVKQFDVHTTLTHATNVWFNAATLLNSIPLADRNGERKVELLSLQVKLRLFSNQYMDNRLASGLLPAFLFGGQAGAAGVAFDTPTRVRCVIFRDKIGGSGSASQVFSGSSQPMSDLRTPFGLLEKYEVLKDEIYTLPEQQWRWNTYDTATGVYHSYFVRALGTQYADIFLPLNFTVEFNASGIIRNSIHIMFTTDFPDYAFGQAQVPVESYSLSTEINSRVRYRVETI